MMTKLFLELQNVSFKKGETASFDNLSWKIYEREQWAIVGPVGSGKSLLAEAINGAFYLREGKIHYHFLNNISSAPINEIAYVSFSERSSNFNYSKHYYQQRFNASESEDSITVKDYFAGSDISRSIPDLFNLEELYSRHFIKLSNGQTRKVRIAKALSHDPKLLILDDPFVGLDDQARENLENIINALVDGGKQVILITNRRKLPRSITHVLELDHFKIKHQYNVNEYASSLSASSDHFEDTLKDLLKILPESKVNFDVAASFSNVNISYDSKTILKNINWTIKRGEKWALLGHNGAGKSTLLSLITGDNPQAYSQDITLFDRKRGSGESIWEIKRNIGFLSPELHLYFSSNMNCRDVVATGFVDTLILTRKLTEKETHLIQTLFAFFNISELEDQAFLRISTGQQRLMLFMRAIIKNPPMLILDEPFQGMDHELVEKCRKVLELFSENTKTIVFVTHLKEEIPVFVDKVFSLKEGFGTTIT